MTPLDILINKWVKHDQPEEMPGLEVCIYETSLIAGLDWAAEEGAETLAQLRADNKNLTDSILALRGETVLVRKMWKETIDENTQLRAELAEARALIGRFANQGVPQAMSWMKEHPESEK